MTTKEKILRKSIDENIKRISEIDSILHATPLIDIIELRKKAAKLIKSNKDYSSIAKEIGELAKKEKECFKIAKIQQNKTNDLISESVTLRMELSDLESELYWIKNRK